MLHLLPLGPRVHGRSDAAGQANLTVRLPDGGRQEVDERARADVSVVRPGACHTELWLNPFLQEEQRWPVVKVPQAGEDARLAVLHQGQRPHLSDDGGAHILLQDRCGNVSALT